jgi:spore maturation protein CgeB
MEVSFSASIKISENNNKSSLILINRYDENGVVDIRRINGMSYSEKYDSNFTYLQDTDGQIKKIISIRLHSGYYEMGFVLFTNKNIKVNISEFSLQKINSPVFFGVTQLKEKKSNEYKVGIVSDEFTYNSFSGVFDAIPILPNSWEAQFEENKPDIFFCESTWSGLDPIVRPWKGQVYASKNFKKENRINLLNILKYCKKNGIPTVFWNKEDPTHHDDRVHDFVTTSKEFDFVFTSAEECVESYKEIHGVSKCFPLAFATNPKLFNPITNHNRTENIVFAGSWYANHEERSLEMRGILDGLIHKKYNIEIYDRYSNDDDPLHMWPEKYKKYIKPSRPHNEMPEVYKSSIYGLNFNTVKTSKTMFARRVFELMSSNTLVISNFATGTENFFGDLIIYPDKYPDRLSSLLRSEIDTLRESALHKVLSEHTYRHRWEQILDRINIKYINNSNALTYVFTVNSHHDSIDAISWFQQYGSEIPDSKILLLIDKSMNGIDAASIYRTFNRFGVEVTSMGHLLNYAIKESYNPINTSHFLAVPSDKNLIDLKKVKASIPHLQYTGSLQISLTNKQLTKYSISEIKDSHVSIFCKSSFESWVLNKLEKEYYIL